MRVEIKNIPVSPPPQEVIINLSWSQARALAEILFHYEIGSEKLYDHLWRSGIYNDGSIDNKGRVAINKGY
jgi:hypothetical protein